MMSVTRSELDMFQSHSSPFSKSARLHLSERRDKWGKLSLINSSGAVLFPVTAVELLLDKEIDEKVAFYHSLLQDKKSLIEKIFSEPYVSLESVEVATPQIESYLKAYFKKKKKVYPSDVSRALGIDYAVVREVFDRFAREDKLKVAQMAR